MRIKLLIALSAVLICGLETTSRSKPQQQPGVAVATQSVTLYPPQDKATGKYNETRACFSFKSGKNKLPASTDWDLGYGFLNISGEDWFEVGTITPDKRSVIKDLGQHQWSDSFPVWALEPLPALRPGERRQITVDSSGDTHQEWARSTTQFAKAKTGQMYLIYVKDNEADFYALFRVEDLTQGDHCTISWKRIPTPELPPPVAKTYLEGVKTGKLLARHRENGVDNYAYAAFSFEFGGNGPEAQKLCRNDWDILFGNGGTGDTFEVTTVVDDRSRIRDLGVRNWDSKFELPSLSAYEEPEREPGVKAVEGHLYLVHTRDGNSNLYALFRVEKLEPGKSVEISWKVIPAPNKH